MDYFELIDRRQSCRAYQDRPVEQDKLEKVLEAARIAPSASNGQPWRYVAVTGAQTLKYMAPLMQGPGFNGFVSQAPCLIAVWEAESNLSARFGARHKDQPYSSIDIGLSVGQLCLAATALGLSTCIMGWFDEPQLMDLLQIPTGARLRLVIALGYAKDETARPKKRKAMDEIVKFIP